MLVYSCLLSPLVGYELNEMLGIWPQNIKVHMQVVETQLDDKLPIFTKEYKNGMICYGPRNIKTFLLKLY